MEEDSRFRLVLRATSAGTLAGATVGLGEIMLVVLLGGSTSNLHAALWAVVAYGLLGLLGGLALGLVLALLPHPPGRAATYASVWALVFASLGLFLTRYRLYRDLFHEGIRTFSLEGLLFNGGLLVAFGLLFFLLRWLWLRPLLRPITSVRGSSLACVLVLVLGLWHARALFRSWRWALRPDDVVARYGVVWRVIRSIPRVRVQHVDVRSGPVDRALGLVEVSLHVAGSAGPVLTIPGLAPAEAEALRAALLDSAKIS